MTAIPLEQAQEVLRSGPVIFLGSGTSIATGMAFGTRFPSMWSLGDALFGQPGEDGSSSARLPRDKVPQSLMEPWALCRDAFAVNPDFEQVLNELGPGHRAFHVWIARAIRKLVGSADVELRRKLLSSRPSCGRKRQPLPERFALAQLLRYVTRGAPPRRPVAHVVTTNYDHLVEYACDTLGLRCHTGFVGHSIKRFERQEGQWGIYGPVRSSGRRRVSILPHVRLYKPHGSLNWFQRGHECLESETHPRGGRPLLVAPDPRKYRSVLVTDVFDSHLSWAKGAVKRASSLLIHGYGFNDQHLELDARKRLRADSRRCSSPAP